jgi:signal transduction histidine kinase
MLLNLRLQNFLPLESAMNVLKYVLAAFAAGLISVTSFAADHASADEAVALVQKGVAYVKANGKEKALAAFNDPKGSFVKGELYLFAYSTNGDGVNLAHGQNPKMVGKVLINMKDNDGVELIKEATKVANSAEGKGWLNYNWPNSVTGKIEPKRSYVERVGDIWIACGIYRDMGK